MSPHCHSHNAVFHLLTSIRILSFITGKIMNAMVNKNPGVGGGTADAVLAGQLPVSESQGQVF